MQLTRTIAFRLFLLIASVQTIILGAFTLAALNIHQSHLKENVIQGADRLSDFIARSTQYSMLLNQKDDVQRIIASVGNEPGIEGIRIFNKQGLVVFSTSPEDLNKKVDMNAESCVSCHTSAGLVNPHPTDERLSRIFTKHGGGRVLGLITPIRNAPDCSNADCHAHPANKTILGVLDVKMSLAQVDKGLADSEKQLLTLSLGAVLLIGLVSGGFIWLVVRRPVKKLSAGMEMVSSGMLDHHLDATGSDELGQLARTFNDMTTELARARQELTTWSETLERKVKDKTADLEKAHKQMVKVEKLASLGNLASSVAHELNNPLEGILTFARLLMKRIAKSALPAEEARTYSDDLKLIADESLRCGNIVKNLLVFARQKETVIRPTKLRDVIDRCILLMNHHAGMHNVTIQLSCPDEVTLECDPDQIQQVFIIIVANAIESMTPPPGNAGGGTLTIAVSDGSNAVTVRFTDTGAGMSEEVKAHIFEHLFTTKSEGKGVGLGLAVAYGIIERHHGAIDVESALGRGTTFAISLPLVAAGRRTVNPAAPPLEGVS